MPSDASQPWHRRVLYALTNWALFMAGLINLAVGTWSAVKSDATIAVTSLTAGLVLLFAATIDRFESLKGLGIEAKTRQLDRKLEQADEALRKLRELTELTGAALVDLNSKVGRWSSPSAPRDAFDLAQRVRSIMQSLGSEKAAIATALTPWARILCHDLATAVAAPVTRAINERMMTLDREMSAIPQPIAPANPDFQRIVAARKVTGDYIQRLRKVHQFELHDYPERFMEMLSDVPLPAEVVAPVREKAERFGPQMLVLRETMSPPNPEAWFDEIESARAAARS